MPGFGLGFAASARSVANAAGEGVPQGQSDLQRSTEDGAVAPVPAGRGQRLMRAAQVGAQRARTLGQGSAQSAARVLNQLQIPNRVNAFQERVQDRIQRMRAPVVDPALDQALRAGLSRSMLISNDQFECQLCVLQNAFSLEARPLSALLADTERLLNAITQGQSRFQRAITASSVSPTPTEYHNLKQQLLTLKTNIIIRQAKAQLLAVDVNGLLASKGELLSIKDQLQWALSEGSPGSRLPQEKLFDAVIKMHDVIEYRLPYLAKHLGLPQTGLTRVELPQVPLSAAYDPEVEWEALCQLQANVHALGGKPDDELLSAPALLQRTQSLQRLRDQLTEYIRCARAISDAVPAAAPEAMKQPPEHRLNFLVSISEEARSAYQTVNNLFGARLADYIEDTFDQCQGLDGVLLMPEDERLECLADLLRQQRMAQSRDALAANVNSRLCGLGAKLSLALSTLLRQRSDRFAQSMRQALMQSPLDESDAELLMEQLNDLLSRLLADGVGADAVKHFKVISSNTSVLYRGLARYAQQLSTTALTQSQQADIFKWIVRLGQNTRSLVSSNLGATVAFDQLLSSVFSVVSQDAMVADRLADHVKGAAIDAACTDWAATVLIDVQAIVESVALEKALSNLCRGAVDFDSREVAKIFSTGHGLPLARLARFSAFKQFLMENEYFQRDNTESIEQALFLYGALNDIYSLPGGLAASRMQYGGYALDIFGKALLEKAYQHAQQMLSLPSISENKALLLENLSAFGVHIWDKLTALLPEGSPRGRTVSAVDRDIQLLVDRVASLETTDKDYAKALGALRESHRKLDSERDVILRDKGKSDADMADLLASVRFC